MTDDINDDSVLYGIAVLAIMRKLIEHEQTSGNKDRAKKMVTVADEFAKDLEAARPKLKLVGQSSEGLLQFIPSARNEVWTAEKRVVFLVELVAMTRAPFAPYELKFNTPSAHEAIDELGIHIGLSAAQVDWIRKWYESAEKSHAGGLDWVDMGLFALGGAFLVAMTAGAAAPFVIPVVAGGVGGGAAVLAGLAALGGGAVAAGGWGVAGGLWLLTVGAGLAGAAGGLSVGALVDGISTADPATIAREVLKAQTVFKVLYVDELGETDGTVGDALTRLQDGRKAAQTAKDEALARNEPGAQAVKDADQKLRWFDDAIKWATARLNNASGERFKA